MSMKFLEETKKSYGFVSGEKDGFYILLVWLLLYPALLFHSKFENKITAISVFG